MAGCSRTTTHYKFFMYIYVCILYFRIRFENVIIYRLSLCYYLEHVFVYIMLFMTMMLQRHIATITTIMTERMFV